MGSTVLLAGATGHLGRHLARELAERGHRVRALVRDRATVTGLEAAELVQARVTRPEELRGAMAEVEAVVTAVGITRQRDACTYEQVDYGANRNLLHEALRASVPRFLYVGVANGPDLRHTAMVAAKERFAALLEQAPIAHTVVRPTGFFRDLETMVAMARRGHVWLIGDGTNLLNPIHAEDVARACVDVLGTDSTEVAVGGPEVFTHRQIAELAIACVARQARIHHVPAWAASSARRPLRWLTPRHVWGPAEFVIEASRQDMVAPTVGVHHLADHFTRVAAASAGRGG